MREYKLRVLNHLVGEEMYSWESQVRQYPTLGAPGIQYFAGEVETNPVPVDCLLWRDVTGHIRGILNHYAVDYPPWEHAGNINIWVDPGWQRKGIATDLLKRSIELYGAINIEQQKYSPQGVDFIKGMIEKGVVE